MVMMFWFDHDVSGWGWFAMTAGMILFWALIITAAVMLFRALRPGTPSRSPCGALRAPRRRLLREGVRAEARPARPSSCAGRLVKESRFPSIGGGAWTDVRAPVPLVARAVRAGEGVVDMTRPDQRVTDLGSTARARVRHTPQPRLSRSRPLTERWVRCPRQDADVDCETGGSASPGEPVPRTARP